MNIGEALRDRRNNFTPLRLFAALAVLFGHSYDLSLGRPGSDPITQYFIYPLLGTSLPSLAVTLFFITSGFLVTASYIQRKSLTTFIEARALRIFPGLIVAVLFTVFAVGPIVTTEAYSSYFQSPITWSYVEKNITLINGVQFVLPGVFSNNPFPSSVNGSLWTLPIEVTMYIWVAIFGALALLFSRAAFNGVCLMLCLLYFQSSNNFFIIHGAANINLALSFMLGGFFYVNRDHIPLSFIGFFIICIFTYLSKTSHLFEFLKAVCLTYLMLLVALNPKFLMPSIDNRGDISYGVYIYAFPVQQAIIYFIPQISPLNTFLFSLLPTIALAILSWNYIESPSLKLKGKILSGWRKRLC